MQAWLSGQWLLSVHCPLKHAFRGSPIYPKGQVHTGRSLFVLSNPGSQWALAPHGLGSQRSPETREKISWGRCVNGNNSKRIIWSIRCEGNGDDIAYLVRMVCIVRRDCRSCLWGRSRRGWDLGVRSWRRRRRRPRTGSCRCRRSRRVCGWGSRRLRSIRACRRSRGFRSSSENERQ